MYSNPSNNMNADILDCTRDKQFFCQTDANNKILKVYSKDENGYFVEDGSVSKGYLSGSTVLFKNLIGRYDTDDHLVDVHVSAVHHELNSGFSIYQMIINASIQSWQLIHC